MGYVNEMWRNRVVLLTLTLTVSLTLNLFSSYSYFIHSYDRLRHIILILTHYIMYILKIQLGV